MPTKKKHIKQHDIRSASLHRIAKELHRRAEYWRKEENNLYGLATSGVYVALKECAGVIEAEAKRASKLR